VKAVQDIPADTASPVFELDENERREVIDLTRHRITDASGQFSDACDNERDAIEKMLAAEQTLIGVLVDIAFGAFMPAVVKGISALVNDIPAAASTSVHAFALALQNESLPGILTDATGTMQDQIKASLAVGDTSEVGAFLTHLRQSFRIAVDGWRTELADKSDVTICATYAAFAPRNTDEAVYRGAIHQLAQKYRKTVEPIGRQEHKEKGKVFGEANWSWTESSMAYWVKAPGGTIEGMALVKYRSGTGGLGTGAPGGDGYEFMEWIPDSLYDVAKAKVKAKTGREIETLTAHDVFGPSW
jgi:hypothetical protein